MGNELFVVGVGVFFAMVLWWAFTTLPGQGWQIVASVPLKREPNGEWRGLNLTYYGVLIASAALTGVAITFVLMASIGVSVAMTLLVAVGVMITRLPAAKIIAGVVEKKPHTFTIGGALFVGALMTPVLLWVIERVAGSGTDSRLAALPIIAAMSIGYTFGEGVGRLACISFGCCYGKPLAECGAWMRGLLGGRSFVFSGETKKVAYEGGLEGKELVPIQAMTSTIHICAGLLCLYLYLTAHFSWAFVISMFVTQAWRVYSETLRSDYRGDSKVSAYQIMAAAAVAYSIALAYLFSNSPAPQPDALRGISSLWSPGVLVFMQSLWILVFLYTGRSMVTASTMSFHVLKDRV
jgi:hypothetical protein